MPVKEERGSRKHILDLVSSGKAPDTLTQLLADAGVVVHSGDRVRPASYEDRSEWDLRAFCRSCSSEATDLRALDSWWAGEAYKGPTWDLLAECTISGRRGYLLVEAKAHQSELHAGGKPAPIDASPQSQENSRRIAASIQRTQNWFRENVEGSSRISIDSHYQLANRLSAAEALASCGVPVVLLYLGFTGDTYFRDYIKDDAHWQRLMATYVEDVVPAAWVGTTTPHLPSGGSVKLLVRSSPVTEISQLSKPATEE